MKKARKRQCLYMNRALTAVKGDAKFNTRYVKGVYHLSIEGIRKGYLVCQKWNIKGYGTGSRVEPPRIKLPPPPTQSTPGPCKSKATKQFPKGSQEKRCRVTTEGNSAPRFDCLYRCPEQYTGSNLIKF